MWPKPASLLFYCLTPDDFTHQGRAFGWERVKYTFISIIINSAIASKLVHNFFIAQDIIRAIYHLTTTAFRHFTSNTFHFHGDAW